MSIYIKGMEMPSNCIDCPFMGNRDDDDCILQSEEANEGFRSWDDMKAGCPLIELPPHGRLIDADALPFVKASEEPDPLDYVRRYAVDSAPTIVPADGGADG